MNDCLFCKICDGEIPCEKVYENDEVIAFHDVNPQAPVHILIIPKKHIATVNDIEPDEAAIVGDLYLAARQIAATEGVAEEGYRLVMNCNARAGQTVFHIHLHMIAGRDMSWPPG